MAENPFAFLGEAGEAVAGGIKSGREFAQRQQQIDLQRDQFTSRQQQLKSDQFNHSTRKGSLLTDRLIKITAKGVPPNIQKVMVQKLAEDFGIPDTKMLNAIVADKELVGKANRVLVSLRKGQGNPVMDEALSKLTPEELSNPNLFEGIKSLIAQQDMIDRINTRAEKKVVSIEKKGIETRKTEVLKQVSREKLIGIKAGLIKEQETQKQTGRLELAKIRQDFKATVRKEDFVVEMQKRVTEITKYFAGREEGIAAMKNIEALSTGKWNKQSLIDLVRFKSALSEPQRNSIVRESESAAIANTLGLIDRTIAQLNKFFVDGDPIPPDVAKEIMASLPPLEKALKEAKKRRLVSINFLVDERGARGSAESIFGEDVSLFETTKEAAKPSGKVKLTKSQVDQLRAEIRKRNTPAKEVGALAKELFGI